MGPVSHPPSPEAILDGWVNLAVDQSEALTLGGPQPASYLHRALHIEAHRLHFSPFILSSLALQRP